MPPSASQQLNQSSSYKLFLQSVQNIDYFWANSSFVRNDLRQDNETYNRQFGEVLLEQIEKEQSLGGKEVRQKPLGERSQDILLNVLVVGGSNPDA